MEENKNIEAEKDVEEKLEEVEDVFKEVEENFEASDKNLEKFESMMQEYEQKQAALFQKEVNLTLKEHDLLAFANVINVSDTKQLETTVDALKAIVNDIKASVSYVPRENAKQDEYDVYIKNKDTKSMIGSKLANLFK